jgi:hypothetical protein
MVVGLLFNVRPDTISYRHGVSDGRITPSEKQPVMEKSPRLIGARFNLPERAADDFAKFPYAGGFGWVGPGDETPIHD